MYCIGPSSTDQIKQEVQSLSDQVFSKKNYRSMYSLPVAPMSLIYLFTWEAFDIQLRQGHVQQRSRIQGSIAVGLT